MKEGIVVKNDGKYGLSLEGENSVIYLKQFSSEESYPTNVVCCLIRDSKNRILMLKRAKSPERDKFCFPGGKLATGEKIQEAAMREVFEETGLKVGFNRVLGCFPSLIYKGNKLHFHVNIFLVLMDSIDVDEIELTDEHSDYAFVDIKDVSNYDLVANNFEILEKGFLNNQGFAFSEIVYKS
jgi:8-oxo-dGTP pyrophosphatase MutT (NUDIX family)